MRKWKVISAPTLSVGFDRADRLFAPYGGSAKPRAQPVDTAPTLSLASDLIPPGGLVIVFVIGPLSEIGAISPTIFDNDHDYDSDYDLSELKLDQFVNWYMPT